MSDVDEIFFKNKMELECPLECAQRVIAPASSLQIYNERFSPEFYLQDALTVSELLIGCYLFTQFPGEPLTGGKIVETEAYCAPEDRASHAFGNRYTHRNSVMYGEGGHAYVYLCYGIHNLFNIVTGPAGTPHGVLIRAIEPIEGVATMMQRRGKINVSPLLTAGPGALSMALGIALHHKGLSVNGPEIWVEKRLSSFNDEIATSPRIGVDYAGEWAYKPWRFFIKDHPFVSRARWKKP